MTFDGHVSSPADQPTIRSYRSTQLFCYEYDLGSKRKIYGNSPQMSKVFNEIDKVSSDDRVPIIIIGESGTGKELVAGAIHSKGPRKNRPYLSISCAEFNSGVLESELFGHVKGAFTGALSDREGVFKLADTGTLFLDEVDAASLEAQTKLLRAVEYGLLRPVGYSQIKNVEVNTRVITATSKDLASLASQKKFMIDLFYRLNGYKIVLPPLRSRGEAEIVLLAEQFLKDYMETNKVEKKFSDEALEELTSYHWPGNVRQLQNVVRASAIYTGSEDLIKPEDVHTVLFSLLDGGDNTDNFDIELDMLLQALLDRGIDMKSLETEYIKAASRRLGGSGKKGVQIMMSDILGVPVRTLREKLKSINGENGNGNGSD